VITQSQGESKITAPVEEKTPAPVSSDSVTDNSATEKAEPIAAPVEAVNNEIPSPVPEVVKAPKLPSPKRSPSPSAQNLDTDSTSIAPETNGQ
jgi:hypothetical protein